MTETVIHLADDVTLGVFPSEVQPGGVLLKLCQGKITMWTFVPNNKADEVSAAISAASLAQLSMDAPQ